MKLLLDSCVWGKVKYNLIQQGYNADWAGDWVKDPGDDEILKIAYNEKRILVTLDKDFGELAVLKNQPHWGIVRLVNISAVKQAEIISYIIKNYSKELLNKPIITVHSNRIRIRF